MDQRCLGVLVLLQTCVCLASEETRGKTVSSGSDVTQICTNDTKNFIIWIQCVVVTDTSGDECFLSFHVHRGFQNGCDSRITLTTHNQVAFLHLSELTADDSGNYTCECTRVYGADVLHLNITVEASHTPLSVLVNLVVIGSAAALVFLTGAVLGRICPNDLCRRGEVRTSAFSLDAGDADDTYTSLQLTASDIYSTISSTQLHRDNKSRNTAAEHPDHHQQERESGSDQDIYENY